MRTCPHKWNSVYLEIPLNFICADICPPPFLNLFLFPHFLPPPTFFLPQLSFLPTLFFDDFFYTPTFFLPPLNLNSFFFFGLKVGGGGERRAERHYFATRSRSDLVILVYLIIWEEDLYPPTYIPFIFFLIGILTSLAHRSPNLPCLLILSKPPWTLHIRPTIFNLWFLSMLE